ncbi:MAG: histidinol-phosphate transaminase [Gemmatimonadetes bacterium 13_1_40CM_3_69_22]|nr:MAG: histidinol-phosphate transaminase [Gemmatimonadetes bacterium 13_1_40CM_3_69_22]OLD96037.1 MAG: histidinol-phosphate transaminase [Gemmatimonadetes bacterium 13_1_20CM_4_69_16]
MTDAAAAALALIKPEVRAQTAYTLDAPASGTLRKLNQNESPFDAPETVKQAVIAAMRDEPWNRYPPLAPTDLLERLAARHGWVADGVLIGNGSNELIQATLAVTVGAGTPVVTPVPTFSLYRLLAAVLGGRHVPVPLTADFQFDLDALVGAARAARAPLIVINSPNNPTGTPLPEGAVARLLAETGALILLDEAYQDFGGPTAVPLLRDQPRLIVLRTFSKAMSLAGLRFGYALAHPAVAAEIAKAKLPYNVGRVTLAAARAALDAADGLAERTRAVRRSRDLLARRLSGIPGLRAFPSAANFVLIRCEARPAADVFHRLVREHGILVRDVSGAPGLDGCLRITAGTDEDVEEVARALQAVLA